MPLSSSALARALARLPRGRLGVNTLLVLVALYLSLTQNLTLWRQVLRGLPGDLGAQELGILATLFLALNLVLVLATAAFSARVLVKPALVFVLVAAAVCAHFMDNYGVIIDAAMVTNLFHTDAREAGELLGLSFFLRVGLFGAIPAIAVARVELVRGGAAGELARRLVLALLVVATFAGCAALNYKSVALWIRAHRDIRLYANPTYPLYALGRYLQVTFQAPRRPPTPIAGDAVRAPSLSGKPRVVVLVLGEAARAENFSLLGYGRPTNPELSAIPGLVSFSNVWSCATATAESVPCMFSRLGRAGFSRSRALAEENLLDVLQRTGVAVTWRENNSDCGSVCARVPTEDFRGRKVEGLCDGADCHDEILLEGLDRLVGAAGGDRIIVLHLLGSHGPSYYRRYPPAFRRFLPECAQNDVQHCSREAIVNAYDNSLVYSDHVVARVIGILQRHQSGIEPTLLYISDHGESLGESGIYLHTLPYALAPDVQKHVPLLLWAPALNAACVAHRRDRPASHDNLFHTLLGLFGVSTRDYREDTDLLRGCQPGGAGVS